MLDLTARQNCVAATSEDRPAGGLHLALNRTSYQASRWLGAQAFAVDVSSHARLSLLSFCTAWVTYSKQKGFAVSLARFEYGHVPSRAAANEASCSVVVAVAASDPGTSDRKTQLLTQTAWPSSGAPDRAS